MKPKCLHNSYLTNVSICLGSLVLISYLMLWNGWNFMIDSWEWLVIGWAHAPHPPDLQCNRMMSAKQDGSFFIQGWVNFWIVGINGDTWFISMYSLIKTQIIGVTLEMNSSLTNPSKPPPSTDDGAPYRTSPDFLLCSCHHDYRR